MGTSSDANCHQQPTQKLPLLRPQLRPTGLSTPVISSDAGKYPDIQETALNSDHVRESPSESASSHDTWPIENNLEKNKDGEIGFPGHSVIHRVSSSGKISLQDVAKERVDIISDRMNCLPEEAIEKLKNELRVILEGSGGSQNRNEILLLQNVVQGRNDLTSKSLMRAHQVQLEILVAINTGILAFLHPNISLSQTCLIDIFLYKRCRNIACQNPLPADDCSCEICTTRKGFCNLCMCVVCGKFDFEVNTCRWIGCDSCSHWTHTDCGIRVGLIGMGPSSKNGVGPNPNEMLSRCQACNRTSELLGWVKDVFQHCAPGWNREALIRELDFVSRIFHASDDPRGRKLYWKCGDLIEELKSGILESTACNSLMAFFQELEMDPAKNPESDENGQPLAPQEACSRIAEVMQEALRKMEMVAEEKMRDFKKARLALEACDRELDDKTRDVAELNKERQQKKQQINEIESIVRLKQAEADMFQLKADEARREAERLQRIVYAKSEKAEEEYASRYLKLRLNEAEAEKQYLFEKMRLQESSRASNVCSGGGEPSEMLLLSKIQDLLKNVYNTPVKPEGL